MININQTSYKVNRIVDATVKSGETVEDCLMFDVQIYVICEENGLGAAFNWNEWNDEIPPKYEKLLECEWEDVLVLSTDFGTYLLAYSNKMCHCFHVRAELNFVDGEEPNSWWGELHLTAQALHEGVCDQVFFDEVRNDGYLQLVCGDHSRFYDMITEQMLEYTSRQECQRDPKLLQNYTGDRFARFIITQVEEDEHE